jgi:hypothetical protein
MVIHLDPDRLSRERWPTSPESWPDGPPRARGASDVGESAERGGSPSAGRSRGRRSPQGHSQGERLELVDLVRDAARRQRLLERTEPAPSSATTMADTASSTSSRATRPGATSTTPRASEGSRPTGRCARSVTTPMTVGQGGASMCSTLSSLRGGCSGAAVIPRQCDPRWARAVCSASLIASSPTGGTGGRASSKRPGAMVPMRTFTPDPPMGRRDRAMEA